MSASTDDSDGDGFPDGFQVDEEDTQQTSGGGGPLLSLDWSKVYNVPEPLRKFAEAPAGFILGIILNVFVGGVETVLQEVLKALLILFEGKRQTAGGGTEPAIGTTQGSLGLADVPRVIANNIGKAGSATGSALLDAVDGVLFTLESAVSAAGPAAPVLLALVLGLVIVVVAYALRAAWTLLVDSINPL